MNTDRFPAAPACPVRVLPSVRAGALVLALAMLAGTASGSAVRSHLPPPAVLGLAVVAPCLA